MNTPHIPLEAQIIQLADKTIVMLKLAREAFLKQRSSLIPEILAAGHEVHRAEKALTVGLSPVTADGGQLFGAERIFVPMHLERVGDNIESFAHAVERQVHEGIVFTDRATCEIDRLLEKALELLEATRDILRTGNQTLVHHVLTDGPCFQATASEFASFHQERLIQGLCVPHASSIYLAMVDYVRGIERHQRDIVQKMVAEPHAPRATGHGAGSAV